MACQENTARLETMAYPEESPIASREEHARSRRVIWIDKGKHVIPCGEKEGDTTYQVSGHFAFNHPRSSKDE